MPSASTEAPPPPEHEQQHAGARERGRPRPAAGQGLAVDQAAGDAGDRGRRAERDDGPDGHAGAVDGREERELVDRDRHGDRAELPPRPGRGRGGDGAGDGQEEQAADGDAHGADGDGSGVGAERLGGARRAEADGGEEDEQPGHWWIVQQCIKGVKGASARNVRLAAARFRGMTDVAVVGPGAIGATFAAAAERAGHAVALCGRRPGPAPVVELPGGAEHALAGPVQHDPSAVGHLPWVLLAVKTHQTAGAVRWLERLCGAGTVVAVLQNGVEHEALVAPLAGPATVLPAIVWCPAEVVAPGRVRQREPAQLSVPDTPAGAALAALLGEHARGSTRSPTSAPRRGASCASTRPRPRWC